MANYSINNIYQGGYSSLKPHYGDIFTGYRVNPATLGLTTDPRNANVLQEVSSKLSTGAKHMEISAVSPEIFESIPNQQLTEINRLSKLTGVDISMHGPIVEPSGLTQHGFSETQRVGAERQMISAIERGHKLKPEGNIPITFHSAAIATGALPQKGKEPEEVMIIDTITGKYGAIPLKERFFPGEEGRRNVKKEIDKFNKEKWTENLEQLRYHAEMGKESLDSSMFTKVLSEAEKKAGKEFSRDEESMRNLYNRGTLFLNSSYNNLKELYDTAWQNSTEEEKKKLTRFKEEVDVKARKIIDDPKGEGSMILMKEIVEKGVDTLKDINPRIYKDLNEFSKEKTVETFSNVALKAFTDKHIGNRDINKTPIISIENPPAGTAGFSTGEELRDVVEKARKKFVEKAVKEGINEREANDAAKKLIGVTWDVGHINMLRKYGYEGEDIVKETEKVAPFVKHVHLSDNFGLEHTELPMGMGNVPIKEIFEKLGKQGFDAKKIIEAGNWWQHMKTAPFKETLEAFGSPIYSMQMSPYWNQNVGFQQDYYGGYGAFLPQEYFNRNPTGFSNLPIYLGGQKQGAEGSRMSGKPME
jgi:hypothetical protein